MDMKKKGKGFFKLNRKADGGFTLVELIVVIAILGILSGIAVPVYNVYIAKANQAKDETLIAAINKAAASAVLECMDEDMENLYDGVLTSNAVKNQENITVWHAYNSSIPVQASFDRYFRDNDGQSLKWYGSLKFENGKFVGVKSMLKGDLVVPTGSDVVDAFNNSSYNNLGVTGVTRMVNNLAGALADFSGSDKLYDTDKFQEVLAELGIDYNTADDQTLANAAVFYVAKCTDELDQAKLWEAIKSKDASALQTYVRSVEGYDEVDAIFIDTALRYAAATAFVYSDYGTEDQQAIMSQTPTNKSEALSYVDQVTKGTNTNWEFYLDDTGESDFDAFCEVMNTLNSNQDTFSTYEGDSLFDNAELQAAMNKLLAGTSE